MNMDTLDYEQFQTKRRSRPWLFRVVLVLLFWLVIFFYLSPLLSAIKLAKAVENRDTVRIAAAVDLPALRKSIARQIVA